MLSSFLLAAFYATDAKLSEGEYQYMFEQFNQDVSATPLSTHSNVPLTRLWQHGKVYSDDGVKAHRFAVFKDNGTTLRCSALA